MRQSEPSVRNRVIRALGMLHLQSSADLLRTQAATAGEERKRSIAEALFRLNDSGYVRLVTELMKSPDEETRRWSIQFARASHNVAFVSSLIDRLRDQGFNGTTSTNSMVGSPLIQIRHTLAEDALAALHRLTFQDLGADPGSWRRWLAANQDASWESLLSQFVQRTLAQLGQADAHVINGWTTRLDDADHAAVLPFVEALLNHPRLDLTSVGPNSSSIGGGPPSVLLLLLELADQGSVGARQLLYQSLTSRDRTLRESSPFAVAVFDRHKAVDAVAARLKDREPLGVSQAALDLVQLGDARGIPILIGDLSGTEWTQREFTYSMLKRYTQEDIPFAADAPDAARREMAARWRQWWRDHAAAFTVKVRAAEIDSEIFF